MNDDISKEDFIGVLSTDIGQFKRHKIIKEIWVIIQRYPNVLENPHTRTTLEKNLVDYYGMKNVTCYRDFEAQGYVLTFQWDSHHIPYSKLWISEYINDYEISDIQ